MEIAMARSAGLVSRQSHATPLEAAVLSYFRSEATNLAARDRQPLMQFVQQLESQRICRVGASPSSATVHKIRIKTKHARYTAEFEEPTIGKPARRFIKEARVLQDMLGMHQDAIQSKGMSGRSSGTRRVCGQVSSPAEWSNASESGASRQKAKCESCGKGS
jgi:CHAD domain-containing protein